MGKFFFLACVFCFFRFIAGAQYAPQAGLTGSTAISATSGQFVSWATQCTIRRGYRNIAIPDSGYANLGDSSLAIGPADNYIVSLGDSGVATLTFANAIVDGPGPDFAVFENGFVDISDPSLAFLELAFVEVSSDGINYTRFPATSLTQTNTQLGNGNYVDAAGLNNLAGKYIANYGTPFDLSELTGIPGLDINNITHVRIIDVVGSITGHASHDHLGNIINDPYPTTFPSSGFDLDAVGVLHHLGDAAVLPVGNDVSISTFPNPATDRLVISVKGLLPTGMNAILTTITGVKLMEFPIGQNANTIDLQQYPAGMYYLTLYNTNGSKWVEKISKR